MYICIMCHSLIVSFVCWCIYACQSSSQVLCNVKYCVWSCRSFVSNIYLYCIVSFVSSICQSSSQVLCMSYVCFTYVLYNNKLTEFLQVCMFCNLIPIAKVDFELGACLVHNTNSTQIKDCFLIFFFLLIFFILKYTFLSLITFWLYFFTFP